jgi:ribosomal-protein-alanine N-acetyltransferase
MTIRPAHPGDLPAIVRIQAASPEAAQWAPVSYLECECLVVDDERHEVLGFLVIREIAPDEHEILNLAVAPAARRRGVARLLLKRALERSGAWFLEVRQSNLPAIQLYESAGFERVGKRENYYRDPPGSAIVMKFDS